MATTVFQVTPYSSYRFVNENPAADNRYHTVSFDSRFDPTNYFQKVQKTDNNFRVQVLSDFTPTLRLYTCKDVFVKNVAFANRPIKNASFLVYDAVPDFSDVDEGAYYLRLTYTDENDVLQDLRTSPLNVAEDWEGTLLLEYTNTYNDKGVVFVNDDKSLLVFGFRIEASFDEYQPLSDDIDYTDQVHDSEVLNNTPFDNEKLYIGTDQLTGGAPDWAIKKMNLITSLNKVSYDGQYYNKVEGSKFTPVRPDHGVLIDGYNVRPTYWSIDIIPNVNFNLEQFQTGDVPTGGIEVVLRKWPDTPGTFTGSFSVSGVFNDNSALVGVRLWNNGLDEFELLIGTTPGAQDINKFNVSADLTSVLNMYHLFSGVAVVYVTIPDGVNIRASLVYEQLDAPNIDPTAPSGTIPKGFLTIYEEVVPGDFELDFDVSTGLGLRAWVGFCLCGTNGTKSRINMYSVGWDRSVPALRGTRTGNVNSQLTLSLSQMPEHTHTINRVPAGASGLATNKAAFNAGNGSAGGDLPGFIGTAGGTDPVVIAPDSWFDVWVIKITD